MRKLLAIALFTATVAQAQVYVPGPGYPLCFPIVVAGGGTTIVCQ